MMKVNYISEINEFYDWLETNDIPKSAIALWHALMHIGNKARWKQSFPVAISTLELKTGFKRSEIFEARNILQQKARITWKSRGGNLSANYDICFFCVHNTDATTDANAYANGYANGNTNGYYKIDKTKQDKTVADIVELFRNVTNGFTDDELHREAAMLLNKYPISNNYGALANEWAARIPKKEPLKPRMPNI